MGGKEKVSLSILSLVVFIPSFTSLASQFSFLHKFSYNLRDLVQGIIGESFFPTFSNEIANINANSVSKLKRPPEKLRF